MEKMNIKCSQWWQSYIWVDGWSRKIFERLWTHAKVFKINCSFVTFLHPGKFMQTLKFCNIKLCIETLFDEHFNKLHSIKLKTPWRNWKRLHVYQSSFKLITMYIITYISTILAINRQTARLTHVIAPFDRWAVSLTHIRSKIHQNGRAKRGFEKVF